MIIRIILNIYRLGLKFYIMTAETSLNLAQKKVAISLRQTNFLCVMRCWRRMPYSARNGINITRSSINVTKPLYQFLNFIAHCDPFLVKINKVHSTNISIFELQLLYVVFEGLARKNKRVDEILEWWFSPSELYLGRSLLRALTRTLHKYSLECETRPYTTEYDILLRRPLSISPELDKVLDPSSPRESSNSYFHAIH